jgi:hypothetical protein
MPNLGVSVRVEGATRVRGKLIKFNRTALENIREKARDRARETRLRFTTEMLREYTSQDATGILARSVSFKTFNRNDGIDVKFYIANRRELEYVTASLGGYFSRFPVRPFIIRPVNGKALVIHSEMIGAMSRGRTPSLGRVPVAVRKYVRWGSRSGGFQRDVITEVGQEEGAAFVQDMQQAVGEAVLEMTQGG